VRTVIRPTETKVATFAEESARTPVQKSGSPRMISVQMPPLESHPVDRLLPQSRLQGMKKLLER
jgi:hypothetical protein